VGTGFVPSSPLKETGQRRSGESPGRDLDRPPLFPVHAVWAPPEDGHGRGDLLLTAEAVTFHPGDASSGRSLTHTGPSLTLTTAVLAAPWATNYLTLEDHRGKVRVATSLFVRRRLRRALSETGVTVHDEIRLRPPAV
jgi:hypothetical protein